MKRISLITSFLLFLNSIAFSQDTVQVKRTPYKLIVAVDKESYYEEYLKEAAFVLPDNTIQLYPGETVYIEVLKENGEIKKMTAVKEIKDPAITLTISFKQTLNKKAHENMMLTVNNPFATELNYKAIIYLFKQKKWASTNVYPVMSKLSGIEIWPDIITSIALNSWTFEK